jgi:superfamily II DNA or RNA helicase
MEYADFLASKFRVVEPSGFDAEPSSGYLFPFQRDLVRWAVKRGRAAIFSDTGTGKTRLELEWSRLIRERIEKPVLILAPLAVAAQTVREGTAIGIDVQLCREPADVRSGINITNYDRLHKFPADVFGAIVLDESGCIKHWETKTLEYLLGAFGDCPYKLCASATPAPNDHAELGTHAEFLNVRSRVEMLSEFFVHDSANSANTGGWRLKGHARQAFWEWVASWAALLRKPSDLGYSDIGYDLPPLNMHHHVLSVDQAEVFATGYLFAQAAHGLTEQRAAKRASMPKRVAACAELMRRDSEQWVVWCELNAEQEALEEALGGEAVSIFGALDAEEKERRHAQWLGGEKRVLLSKVSIFGQGLNWQHCNRMAFVGPTNSFEGWYQAIRRCWRFGQSRAVDVHVVLSESERAILENLKRKEADAQTMAEELSACTRQAVRANVLGARQRHHTYRAPAPRWPAWLRSGS